MFIFQNVMIAFFLTKLGTFLSSLTGAGILFWIYRRLRHRLVWRGTGYIVSVRPGLRLEAWVDYEEGKRTLPLRAEWSGSRANQELLIFVDERVYFPPDYQTLLSETRIEEIEKKISEALVHLKIEHSFTRIGWTSFSQDRR